MHLTGAPRRDCARHHPFRAAGTRSAPPTSTITQTISALFDLNHQEFAALTTALSLLGFTVVAAILLMRTRVRATRMELNLRSDIADLQVQADRLRALLFAEPQILIAWAAGDNRPQISGDTSLLISQDALSNSPQRILAFGTWLPPEPALQMDHAVDALREAGEGFLLNLSTSNGRAIEAMGRAIGGQAIVRIRELGGLRRELAESNLRYRTLLEETELLRDFAAAAPWPIWAKSVEGNLRYANAAYVRATEGASVADAIHRNLELLENDQRAEMSRVLNDNSTFSARLPIVVGGERRIYDVQALKLSGGSAGIAHRRQRGDRAARRAWSGWRKRIAAPSTNCRPAWPCSTASGGLPSTMNPTGGCGASIRPSSTPIPTIPACSTGCAPRANCPSSRTSGPGRPSCTRPIARSNRRPTPGSCPTAAPSASSPRRTSKAASPICSTMSPKASIWRGGSTG